MWSCGKSMEAGVKTCGNVAQLLDTDNAFGLEGLGQLLQEGFVLEGHWRLYKEREFCS